MSTIPNEIFEAFKQKGYTLLVKGKAGTGKTTLSLEFLEKSNGKVYISSRITPKIILKQFPWLEKEEISFIDATQTFIQDENITSQIERAIKFREMPGFLQQLYEIVKDKGECPTVVIDSWDAIRNGIYEENIKNKRIETVLAEMVRYLKFNLILIVESEEHYLDYISDGIVTLRKETIDNRRQRIIEIEKMRSVEINQPEYLFSLHNGRFKSFGRMQEYIPLKKLTGNPQIIKNSKTRLYSGSNALNEFFSQGQRKGAISLIEIGEGVGFEYIWLFVPLIINQLKQNCGVTIFPDEGIDYKIIYNVINKFLPDEKLINTLTFFDFPPIYDNPNSLVKCIKILDQNKEFKDISKEIINILLEKISNMKKDEFYGGIALLGSNKFENRFGIEDLKTFTTSISEFIKLFKTSRIIWISHFNQQIQKFVASMVSTKFKMERIKNTLVIYGVFPFTKLHAVMMNFDSGYCEIELYPIV